MQSIQDTWQKIKLFAEAGVGEWGIAILIALIALACFGLGRLSAMEEKDALTIKEAQTVPEALALGGLFEAAKGGSNYYFPWCSGAEGIPPIDQVWFKSEAAAQKAGYTPAKNCKGLSS
jgi:hypothetical protein